MNKELIKNRVAFTLNNKKFLKENKILHISYFFETISLLISLTFMICIFTTLYYGEDFLDSLLITFIIPYFIFIEFSNSFNYSSISKWLNMNNAFFSFITKYLIKNKIKHNIFNHDFKKTINNNYYFYEYDTINNENCNEALYYWYCIEKESDILDVKEKAFLQIRNIQEFIQSYNKRTENLSSNKNTIESILIQNDIELNNKEKKEIKKISILNI